MKKNCISFLKMVNRILFFQCIVLSVSLIWVLLEIGLDGSRTPSIMDSIISIIISFWIYFKTVNTWLE